MRTPISDKKAFVAELLERLKSRIDSTNESEKEFAKRLGSSEALFKNLSSGSLPSADRLAVLLSEIGETLVLGRDRQSDDSVPVRYVALEGVDYASISLHDAWLSAGPGAENHVSNIVDQLAFRRDWLMREGIDAARASLARVKGDSMAPTLSCGDMVLINQAQAEPSVRRRGAKDRRRSPIYALVEGGEARIKRIERPDEETMILISDNPDYSPEIRTTAQRERLQTTIIGKVVWWGHTVRE